MNIVRNVHDFTRKQQDQTQDDLLNFIHMKPEFDEYVGANIYGLALGYIQNLEMKVKELEAKTRLYESMKKFTQIK